MKKKAAKLTLALALALSGAVAPGAVMPQMPEPAYADTEVWTNVPCAQLLSDVRELEVVLDFTGTASNCVQVAFGRDEDGNGDLSAVETDVAIGWRAGDWFIEDVKGGRRFRECGAPTSGGESGGHGEGTAPKPALPRRLAFRFAVGGDGAKSASVVCDGAAKFVEVLDGDLRWVYDRGWNMAKVTRRGVDSPGEIVLVESDHGGLKFIVR